MQAAKRFIEAGEYSHVKYMVYICVYVAILQGQILGAEDLNLSSLKLSFIIKCHVKAPSFDYQTCLNTLPPPLLSELSFLTDIQICLCFVCVKVALLM